MHSCLQQSHLQGSVPRQELWACPHLALLLPCNPAGLRNHPFPTQIPQLLGDRAVGRGRGSTGRGVPGSPGRLLAGGGIQFESLWRGRSGLREEEAMKQVEALAGKRGCCKVGRDLAGTAVGHGELGAAFKG